MFVLLLVFLPAQLGLHFWPDWAVPAGRRLDYFSPTLYFTDILIGLLFLSEFVRWLRANGKTIFNFQFSIFKQIPIKKLSNSKFLGYWVTGLLIYLNIVFSASPPVSLYKWLKVAEFAFLFWWLRTNLKSQISNLKYLFLPVAYESILGLWQFWQQSSIGGLWYWLGERTFTAATPAIAKVQWADQLLLRPYGTFPHPNVLGGFLAIVLPLLISFLSNLRVLGSLTKIGYVVVLLLGYSVLILTFSRSAILVGLAATGLVILYYFKTTKWKIFLVFLLIPTSLVLLPLFANLGTGRESLSVRQQLNDLTRKQFSNHWFFGTGLGTSPLYSLSSSPNSKLQTSNYSLFGQPPHNIFLLWLAETGIVGGLLAVLFWLKFIPLPPRTHFSFLLSHFSFLVLGLFDHYFLTLHQGQLLLVLVLGLSGYQNKSPS